MGLPNEDCYADEAIACCDMLFEIAANIMEVALCAVQECIVNTPCGANQIAGYVSVGREVQDPMPDYVVVSLTSADSSPGSKATTGLQFINNMRATFQVRILESGWPMPTGDETGVDYPLPDQYMNAARHSYAHAEVMYRALLTAKDLNPFCKPTDCFQQIGPLTPVEPSGGTVGWETFVITSYPLAAGRQSLG